MRLAGIEHFTNRSDTGVVQMFRKTFEKFASSRAIVRMHFELGVNERTDKPGPDCALMIRVVARSQVTAVNWFVIGIIGRERAEYNWRYHSFFRLCHDRSSS